MSNETSDIKHNSTSPMNYELNTSMEKTSHETNSDEKDNKDEFGDRTISIEESVVNSKILHGWPLATAFTGMLLSIFLIALDQTILAPALPFIASDFNSLTQIAWIASGYFLTQTSFLLLWGQVLTIMDRKLTFIVNIALFELGSLVCAVAPGTTVLILGRAIAGVGASGIFIAVLSILAEVTSLETRPKLLGLFGGVFAISSVIGPVIGGVFTTKSTWRLCFWINLPFGFISILAIYFTLGPSPPPPIPESVIIYTTDKIKRWTFGKINLTTNSFFFKLAVLDWTGSILILGCVTSLLLALQYGGNVYPWNSPTVVGCFCSFGILAIIFVLYEWKFTNKSGLLPLRLLRNRTQIGSMISSFMLMFCLLAGTYFLPLFYQARGSSAESSGINILPFMLGITLAAGLSGGLVSYWGRYKPILVFGPFLICIGSGLLTTINESTSTAKLVGYQLITALGVGAVLQLVIIAVQAEISDSNPEDIPQATALVSLTQILGGTIGIAISSSVFNSKLAENLVIFAPDAPFELVKNSVSAIFTLPIEQQAGVVHAYIKALNTVYAVSIAAGGIASLAALLIRDKSVKGKSMMEMA